MKFWGMSSSSYYLHSLKVCYTLGELNDLAKGGERMWSSFLKILAYFFGIVAGLSLVMGVILRLAKGPWGAIMFNILPRSYIFFAQVCLLFAIALGVATLLERTKKEEK